MDSIMRLALIALGMAVLSLLGGCASPHYPRGTFADQPNEAYTLASGDRLRVIVFGQDSLSNSYSVDGSGRISMPLIGLVDAQGCTTHQLEEKIAAKLRSGFLRDPRVSVEVEAYRPFFVLGEVTTAGQYPFVNGLTVQTAIAIAGGYSPRASKYSADLTRVINGVPITYSVPVTEFVRPGDTIMVRERFF
jgi:polysaccharide export outer membrane protein